MLLKFVCGLIEPKEVIWFFFSAVVKDKKGWSLDNYNNASGQCGALMRFKDV